MIRYDIPGSQRLFKKPSLGTTVFCRERLFLALGPSKEGQGQSSKGMIDDVK